MKVAKEKVMDLRVHTETVRKDLSVVMTEIVLRAKGAAEDSNLVAKGVNAEVASGHAHKAVHDHLTEIVKRVRAMNVR